MQHNTKEKEALSVFQYEGQSITFQLGNGDVMVNATEMAKSFGKPIGNWLRLDSTKEFLQVLENERYSEKNIVDNQLIKVVKGGIEKQGTWMHEDVALEFARWLSPVFAIWCNDRIKELLKFGMTAMQPTLEAMLNDPDLVIGLANKLKEERAKNLQLQGTINEQTRELKESAPKVEYYETTLSSKGLLSINMIASCLKTSAVKLNRWLCSNSIQYKQSQTYFLYQKYRDEGYATHKPHSYTDANGETKTRQHLYWTEKGKEFIINLYNQKVKNAGMERVN